MVNKKAEIVRVYLPPDANCLLSVADHCLRSRDYVNVIVAGKQPALDYLTMDEAVAHCARGIGIWEWASSDDGAEPGRRARVRRATSRRSRRWRPRRRCCASTCPTCACGWSTSSTSCACSPTAEHPHGLSGRASSTRCSRPTSR